MYKSITNTAAKRVSVEQRRKMFAIMQEHPAFALGNTGPLYASEKKKLLHKLAIELNSMKHGCVKTPEKWLKCWFDWKSDVKAKSTRLEESIKTGSYRIPLTPLEASLMKFFGKDVPEVTEFTVPTVESLPGGLDPLKAEILNEEQEEDSSMDVANEEVISCAEEDTVFEPLSPTIEVIQSQEPQEKNNNSSFRLRRPRRFTRTRSSYEYERPNKTSATSSQNNSVDTAFLVELERKRVYADIRRADAATIMAEAAHIQAEAARTQAETARIQAEGVRTLGEVMRMQIELIKTIIKK